MDFNNLMIGTRSTGGLKDVYLYASIRVDEDGSPWLSMNGSFTSPQLRRLNVNYVRIWLYMFDGDVQLKLDVVPRLGSERTFEGRRRLTDLPANGGVLTHVALHNVNLAPLGELTRCVLIAALEAVDTKLGVKWADMLAKFRAASALTGR